MSDFDLDARLSALEDVVHRLIDRQSGASDDLKNDLHQTLTAAVLPPPAQTDPGIPEIVQEPAGGEKSRADTPAPEVGAANPPQEEPSQPSSTEPSESQASESGETSTSEDGSSVNESPAPPVE